MNSKLPLLALLVLACFSMSPSLQADDKKTSADEAAIRRNIDTFISAYGKQDAAALASLWAESGKFLSQTTGKFISGRKEIEAEYRAMFKDAPAGVLSVKDVTLRFITDDVAVEEGIAHVAVAKEAPTEDSYQAIHVKKEGRWLIDSIRETAMADEDVAGETAEAEGAKKAQVPELEKLAWMIGDWVDAGDDSRVNSSCSWVMGKGFIRKDFAVEVAGLVEMEGVEIIGWDASDKQFRSWVFDSGGGFGSAIWTKSDNGWIKKISGTTAAGKKLYAEHVIHQINENTYRWEAHGREADGVLLPNIPSTEVVRVTAAASEK